ncbi:MAG: hypothetical protein HY071_00505 [Chloroflexi bacterium]|nr:hypothetical protein [Chloroflexota bacterium]
MKRWLASAVAAVILTLGVGLPSAAAPEWCEVDPILHFSDGGTVRLTAQFRSVYLTPSTVATFDVTVAKGTHVSVTIPKGLAVPEKVNIINSSSQDEGTASVNVTVSGGKFPITVIRSGPGDQYTVTHGQSTGTRLSFSTEE